MNEKDPSPAQLIKLCRAWQKTLRLQDWRVRIRYAEMGELEDGQVGRCKFWSTDKSATILIRPSAQFGSDAVQTREPVEYVLVHELAHLHISPLKPENPILEEQVIDCLTHALYRLKYPRWCDPSAN